MSIDILFWKATSMHPESLYSLDHEECAQLNDIMNVYLMWGQTVCQDVKSCWFSACSIKFKVRWEMVDGEISGAEALEKLTKHEAAECDTKHQNGDSQLSAELILTLRNTLFSFCQ